MKYGFGCGWPLPAAASADAGAVPSDDIARVSSVCITSSSTESGLTIAAGVPPFAAPAAAACTARLPSDRENTGRERRESPVNQRCFKAMTACSLQFALPESLPDASR